jgi:hypothetical protein
MAEHLESLAWHVTAGVTRGTRNRDTKVGPALTAGPTNGLRIVADTVEVIRGNGQPHV